MLIIITSLIKACGMTNFANKNLSKQRLVLFMTILKLKGAFEEYA